MAEEDFFFTQKLVAHILTAKNKQSYSSKLNDLGVDWEQFFLVFHPEEKVNNKKKVSEKNYN